MKKMVVLILSVLLLIGVMSCGRGQNKSKQYSKCTGHKADHKRAYYNSIQYR
jgi:hypothetical protein